MGNLIGKICKKCNPSSTPEPDTYMNHTNYNRPNQEGNTVQKSLKTPYRKLYNSHSQSNYDYQQKKTPWENTPSNESNTSSFSKSPNSEIKNLFSSNNTTHIKILNKDASESKQLPSTQSDVSQNSLNSITLSSSFKTEDYKHLPPSPTFESTILSESKVNEPKYEPTIL